MNIPQEMINKLHKIINLANNNGASEGEVFAAMGRARNILQQYDLSLEEFASLSKDKDDKNVIEESIFKTACFNQWVSMLLYGIGNLTNTNYFYYKKAMNKDFKTETHYIFTGTKTDLGIASALASYLFYAAKGFADIYTDAQNLRDASSKRRYRSSFYFGFAERVKVYAAEILEKEKEDARKESQSNERAVAVIWNQVVIQKKNNITRYENNKLLTFKLKKQKRNSSIKDMEGYSKGKEVADTVLNKNPKGFIEV